MKIKKILIIDNIDTNRKILNEILGEEFILKSLNSGVEVIKNLYEFYPDLILLDIKMPKVDGLEVCRRVRANADFKKMKIIFVSADAMQSQRDQALAAGGNAYVIEPFDHNELIHLIDVTLFGVEEQQARH